MSLTLEKLHRGADFTAESLFDGFVTEGPETLRRSLAQRYGEGVHRSFDEAARRTAGWGESDYLVQRDNTQRERLAAQHPDFPRFVCHAIAAYASRRR